MARLNLICKNRVPRQNSENGFTHVIAPANLQINTDQTGLLAGETAGLGSPHPETSVLAQDAA